MSLLALILWAGWCLDVCTASAAQGGQTVIHHDPLLSASLPDWTSILGCVAAMLAVGEEDEVWPHNYNWNYQQYHL